MNTHRRRFNKAVQFARRPVNSCHNGGLSDQPRTHAVAVLHQWYAALRAAPQVRA